MITEMRKRQLKSHAAFLRECWQPLGTEGQTVHDAANGLEELLRENALLERKLADRKQASE